jgi:hypothetical protein
MMLIIGKKGMDGCGSSQYFPLNFSVNLKLVKNILIIYKHGHTYISIYVFSELNQIHLYHCLNHFLVQSISR